MDIISPIPEGAAHAAGPSGSLLSSLLEMVTDKSGLFADDSPDGWLGIAMSGLAGVATALAVAIVLSVYFRSGYRSTRDIFKHGLAAAAVLALLAFAATDMRHAALAYLGINPSKPAVEFEIRLPKAAALTIARSNCIPTGTRRWRRCKPRWAPMTTAAASSGVRSRSNSAPPTGS